MPTARIAMLLLSLLAAAPAAAGSFAPAPPTTPPVVGGDPEAPAPSPGPAGELPPPEIVTPGLPGDALHVYFFDLAWAGRDVHLTLRNAGNLLARVRVVHTKVYGADYPGGPFTRLGEDYEIGPGSAAHASFENRRDRTRLTPLDHVVVASDRPLHVGGRSLDQSYGHELLPFAIDCEGSGDAGDDGTPYGLLCWIAKHE